MYESKVLDIPVNQYLFGNGVALPASGAAGRYSLVGIPQGSGLNQRQGLEISVTGISVNGNCVSTPIRGVDPADACGIVRFYVVQDMQHNAIDYLTGWPAGPATNIVNDVFVNHNVLMFTNPSNKQRFRILGQTIVTMNPRTNDVSNASAQPFSKNFSIDLNFKKPIHITYSDGGGLSTSITSSDIFMIAVTDGSGSFDGSLAIEIATRTLFIG